MEEQAQIRKRRPNGSVSRQDQKKEASKKYRLKQSEKERKQGVRYYQIPMTDKDFDRALRIVERYALDHGMDALRQKLPINEYEKSYVAGRNYLREMTCEADVPRLPSRKCMTDHEFLEFMFKHLDTIVANFESGKKYLSLGRAREPIWDFLAYFRRTYACEFEERDAQFMDLLEAHVDAYCSEMSSGEGG